MRVKNIYANPGRPEGEVFETLLERSAFRIERIVSTGQSTPPGEWYDQCRDEWIILLSGKAGLRFEGENQEVVLQPGDSLLIPSHKRHRVEWTASDRETVWLAVHFSP
jgi:cupin 2 domain-containing protein